MRTTLNLDDDVLREAKRLSELQGKSLGAVISNLIRKGLRSESDFPKFEVAPSAPTLTLGMVQEALDELNFEDTDKSRISIY